MSCPIVKCDHNLHLQVFQGLAVGVLITLRRKQIKGGCYYGQFWNRIDCSNVRQIVHVEVADDICSYIQETGWAGGDGEFSLVTLLQCRTWHSVDEDTRQYVDSMTECRWDVLLRDTYSYSQTDMGSDLSVSVILKLSLLSSHFFICSKIIHKQWMLTFESLCK